MRVNVPSDSLSILSRTFITLKVLIVRRDLHSLFLKSSEDLDLGDSRFVSLPQFSYL